MRRFWLNLIAKWRLGCWLYNHQTDDDVDLLLWRASQSNPTILKVMRHELIFEFMGLGVKIWNSNKWYAWASDGLVTDGKKVLMRWEHTCPSPHVIWCLKTALNDSIGIYGKKTSASDILYEAAVEADDG